MVTRRSGGFPARIPILKSKTKLYEVKCWRCKLDKRATPNEIKLRGVQIASLEPHTFFWDAIPLSFPSYIRIGDCKQSLHWSVTLKKTCTTLVPLRFPSKTSLRFVQSWCKPLKISALSLNPQKMRFVPSTVLIFLNSGNERKALCSPTGANRLIPKKPR